MIPTYRPEPKKLPRARVRPLAGDRKLVKIGDRPSVVIEQDGRVSAIQPVE